MLVCCLSVFCSVLDGLLLFSPVRDSMVVALIQLGGMLISLPVIQISSLIIDVLLFSVSRLMRSFLLLLMLFCSM